MKISNKNARPYVKARKPFKGSNLSGCCRTLPGVPETEVYVVYSYGYWPLFIHVDGTWFENTDRYSVTTSKHRNQTHPHVADTVQLPNDRMEAFLNRGWGALVRGEKQ